MNLTSFDHRSNKSSLNVKGRRLLGFLKAPIISICLVSLVDPLILLLLIGTISRTTLILIIFLEGSVGLIASGVIALSATPSISKAGEMFLGRTSWSREGEKNAEKVALKWAVASSLLALIGFLLAIA